MVTSRIWFTAAQKAELWERWKNGQSAAAIARVRPGVELVRASLVPTSELITLDFPTFDGPRKAISGSVGTGKCPACCRAGWQYRR